MSEAGKRPWILAVIYDDRTNKASIERTLCCDVMDIFNNPKVNPKPRLPNFHFVWIHADKLEQRLSGHKQGLDALVEISIISSIRVALGKNLDKPSVALLLDNDLMVRYNLEDTVPSIVKHGFFKPSREPLHFVFCYGNLPNGDMRHRDESPKVCMLSGCVLCKKNPVTCRHTCYWQMIGAFLGGLHANRQEGQKLNESVRKLIPPPYIY